MLKYTVVGLGIYQGLEFLLERGLGEAWGKRGVVASRLHNSLRLLQRAPAFRCVLGRDREAPAEPGVGAGRRRCPPLWETRQARREPRPPRPDAAVRRPGTRPGDGSHQDTIRSTATRC
jgi:hypothetical protein